MKIPVIVSILMLASWLGGWKTGHWQRDSQTLKDANYHRLIIENAREQAQKSAQASARALENRLEALRNALPKKIQAEREKNVFSTPCVSDDFVRMYNIYSTNVERSLSGKFENEMHDAHATVKRK